MDEIVKLSKAMSDINRLKIVALIHRDGSLCVCEICDTLELSQPLVSRNLKQLKAAGILDAKKNGKWAHYSIAHSQRKLLQVYLEELSKVENTLPDLIHCHLKYE